MSDQNRNFLPKAQNTDGEGPSKPAAASETNGAAGSRPRPRPRPNARDATTEDAQKPPVQSGPPEQSNGIATEPAGKDPPPVQSGPPEQSNGIATDPSGKDPPREDSGGWDPDRPIGYRNPPRKDAFRGGGGSPNPGGKRKIPMLDEACVNVLSEPVPGTDMVMGEVLMRKTVARGMGGEKQAVRICFDLWEKWDAKRSDKADGCLVGSRATTHSRAL